MNKTLFLIAASMAAAFLAAPARADMALYVNGGVANLNPTIGMDVEFQYGYASVALGAGVMALNDFGMGAGIRGYLFGIDGGPYIEALYGTTAEKAVTHLDSNDKEVVDSVTVYQGISGLLGWRFFFGDGWNMTLGGGVAQANKQAIPIFNLTAGIMVFGDEAAQKNAEKYGRSFKPPEPADNLQPEMPGPDEGVGLDIPADMEAESVLLTPTADVVIPAAEEITPAAQTITNAAEAVTPAAQAITTAAEAITPTAKAAKPAVKKTKKAAKTAVAPVKVTGAAKAK